MYARRGFSNMPMVVKNLIIINALFFLARFTLGQLFHYDLNETLGLYYFKSPEFSPYQLISYMFMHGGLSHIFFNMFALWMFGTQIENFWGPKRFLNYYLITGFGAAFIHYLIIHFQVSGLESYFTTEQISGIINSGTFDATSPLFNKARSLYSLHHTPVVGASGAVFGILLAYGMTFPNQIIYLNLLFPIKAKYFVIIYGLLEFVMGVQNSAGDNVAHFAHIGGMLFGFILIKYWKKNDLNFY
jgi:membrane associated rhomboid family serine protease